MKGRIACPRCGSIDFIAGFRTISTDINRCWLHESGSHDILETLMTESEHTEPKSKIFRCMECTFTINTDDLATKKYEDIWNED